MNPQTTNPSTNRQTKTRAKPSCFNPCQGRFGHPRHNVSTAFFFMERLVFPVWTCRWHFYWRPNQNVTSAFHPQKPNHQFFGEKKHPHRWSLAFGREWKGETMTNWYLESCFLNSRDFQLRKTSQIWIHIHIHIVFFLHVFFPSLDDFFSRISFCNRILFTNKKWPIRQEFLLTMTPHRWGCLHQGWGFLSERAERDERGPQLSI